MSVRKIYSTNRLVIRPLKFEDFDVWSAAHELSGPKQDKFDLNPWPKEKRSQARFNESVERHNELARLDETYIWNLFLKDGGQLIGWLDISTIKRDPYQMANLGWFIINSYRKKGLAQEALRALIPKAFEDLEFHRLEAVMDLDNEPSIRLAEKVGLYREGIKKHYWYQNGRWEDQMVFIATPEVWEQPS